LPRLNKQFKLRTAYLICQYRKLFLVLSINVLLAGRGIPIAWCIVKANQPGSGKPHWQKLIRQIKEAIPTVWTVIVPADRRLYAPWLYQVIVEAGWHPFLRINQQGLVKISPHGQWQPLDALVSAPGQSWSGQVVCFKTRPQIRRLAMAKHSPA
jgi:hypothetical protein